MREKGYDNKFIYAGHGYFDNMNYFFETNGFASVDRTNFAKDEITFTNAWGVCDEDLFLKVIKEARSFACRQKAVLQRGDDDFESSPLYLSGQQDQYPVTYRSGRRC